MKKNQNKILLSVLLLGLAGIGAYIIYVRNKNKKLEPIVEPEKELKLPKILKDAYDNLVFELDKDIIKPISFPYLDELAENLRESSWNLVLEGHTDNLGSEKYNLNLSQKRAEAVKKYLEEKGINPNRITAIGFGESKPIADNSTAEGREKNRRVEFKINKNILA